MKFSIVTFGCKVNQYESQLMREFLGEFYAEAKPGERADVVLVNTCSVTDRADRQCRQALRRARKGNPGALVVAAGCHARRPGVDLVGEGLADSIAAAPTPGALCAALNRRPTPCGRSGGSRRRPAVPVRALRITGFAGHTRAFVKVQDGCNRRCSFCVVPLIRGAEVSRPASDIAGEVSGLASGGVPEIVLCGIRLNAYRDPETNQGLVPLLERLLEIPALRRLRLSSIYPGRIEQGLLEMVAGHPKVCRHLHLPVQSGSDRILNLMRRGYDSGAVLELARRARGLCPEMGLTADILAGFPGETDEDFRNTTALIRECGFHRLHLFPFSPRPGTPAARLPQVPAKVVATRMNCLRRLNDEIQALALRRLWGRETDVVVEGRGAGGWWRGTTGEYHSVRFQGSGVRAGAVARVKITGTVGATLVATTVPEGAIPTFATV